MLAMLAALPVSPNYQLRSYGFGSGGDTASPSYQADGSVDPSGSSIPASTSAGLGSGVNPIQQAAVPPAPTVVRDGANLTSLHLTIATGGNPADAEFLVAVSTDAFATVTQYVQADLTLGDSPVWQTATALGDGAGVVVTGLHFSTTYTFKLKARHGSYTESAYGPITTYAIEAPSLSFGGVPSSIDYQVAPDQEDTAAIPLTVQTNADRYTVSLYADNSAGGANPRNATTSDLIANANGFTPSDTTTPVLFTSGSGFGYRVASVVGSELADFATDSYRSFAYGTTVSHPSAVAVMLRQATKPAGALDSATLTFKVRADWSVPASSQYQTTVHFDVVPVYDGL